MAEHGAGQNGAGKSAAAIVEVRIVSPKGARVTEKVFVLSKRASRQLEIHGEVPPLRHVG